MWKTRYLHVVGRTEIGTASAPNVPDIIIQGTGVEPEHCFIDNIHGVITLYPLARMCAVDGVLVTEPTRLPQGQCQRSSRSNHLIQQMELHVPCTYVHLLVLENQSTRIVWHGFIILVIFNFVISWNIYCCDCSLLISWLLQKIELSLLFILKVHWEIGTWKNENKQQYIEYWF